MFFTIIFFKMINIEGKSRVFGQMPMVEAGGWRG